MRHNAYSQVEGEEFRQDWTEVLALKVISIGPQYLQTDGLERPTEVPARGAVEEVSSPSEEPPEEGSLQNAAEEGVQRVIRLVDEMRKRKKRKSTKLQARILQYESLDQFETSRANLGSQFDRKI